MDHEISVQAGAGTVQARPGDLGRRVAARRRELGLTRDELAVRSGAAPAYVEYVEDRAATPGAGVLLRIADALETTVGELTGATVTQPPGRGGAVRGAELYELVEAECRELLSTHGVGRVAVFTPDGPSVVPVNYLFGEDGISFRTAWGTVAATADGALVAFEVDRIDEAFSQGWSVLVVGRGRAVADREAVRRLEERAHSRPWAGGSREIWLTITPERITGRRVVNPDGTPWTPAGD
ncbi:helix-turn-helix domain-containing protein [Streptomyces sp. NPDC055709]